MIKLYELRELMKLVNQSSLDEIEWEHDGVSISIKKEEPMVLETSFSESQGNSGNLNAQVELEDVNLQTIRSPYIGIFSDSPRQGTAPYIKVGDKATADTIVCNCVLDALQLTHMVRAGVNGEIVKVLVENGQVIEYGQPLFLVNAKGE